MDREQNRSQLGEKWIQQITLLEFTAKHRSGIVIISAPRNLWTKYGKSKPTARFAFSYGVSVPTPTDKRKLV